MLGLVAYARFGLDIYSSDPRFTFSDKWYEGLVVPAGLTADEYYGAGEWILEKPYNINLIDTYSEHGNVIGLFALMHFEKTAHAIWAYGVYEKHGRELIDPTPLLGVRQNGKWVKGLHGYCAVGLDAYLVEPRHMYYFEAELPTGRKNYTSFLLTIPGPVVSFLYDPSTEKVHSFCLCREAIPDTTGQFLERYDFHTISPLTPPKIEWTMPAIDLGNQLTLADSLPEVMTTPTWDPL